MQRSPYAEKGPRCGENPVLFLVVLVVVSVALVIIPRMQMPAGLHAAPLGWMSEQWLAEHRGS